MASLLSVFLFFCWGSEAVQPAATLSVPAGELRPFWIRPKKEGAPPSPVRVGRFEIDVTPVTNDDFLSFVRAHERWRKSEVPRLFADPGYLSQFASDAGLKEGIERKAPVTNVSWFAARAYCESRGMRLPTLMEWEYAAAADETSPDATRNPVFLSRILEWYGLPRSDKGLSPVGRKAANFYGLHDLHGLIWEWTEDFNSNLITGESRTDGSLNKDLFCGAGGMSAGDKENYAAFMRFAFRSALTGSSTTWNLGFRCVKEVGHR